MSVFNLKYIHENYKSKYSSYLDDDDEDEEENKKKETAKDHLTKEEIQKALNIISLTMAKFPKIKKCCDFIDLNDKEKINDEGERESEYDRYYNSGANAFISLIDGDVLSGYPDFRTNGSEAFDSDSKEFIKAVNDEFNSRGVKAKFMAGPKDEEAINYGVKSIKDK